MKKKTILITALAIFTTSAFAEIPSTGFSKNSPQLQALGSAFKNESTTRPKIDPSMMISYAGSDVKGRPGLIS